MDGTRSSANRLRLVFLLTAVMGGSVLGGLLAVVAMTVEPVPASIRIGIAGSLLLMAVGQEAGILRGCPLPRSSRQVRQSISGQAPVIAAGTFGFELGLGIRTHTTSLAIYIAVVTAIGMGEPLAGLLIGLGFGATRGMGPIDRVLHDGESWSERLTTNTEAYRWLGFSGALMMMLVMAAQQ